MDAKRKTVAICCATAFFGLAAETHAVAFKLHNQTNYKFRMRVLDRGNWRPWIDIPKDFWDVTAANVERTDHDVEIDIFTANAGRPQPEWVAFYRGRHGSRVFTRVLHLFEYVPPNGQRSVVMTWHDEPPKCRDKPVFENGQFRNGCLVKSGWTDDLLRKAAVKIAETAIWAILGGA